jgi:hypothetical protein
MKNEAADLNRILLTLILIIMGYEVGNVAYEKKKYD